ncbi:MAG: hypothetical protein ABFD62_17835 [Syntrophaceae bacterium]
MSEHVKFASRQKIPQERGFDRRIARRSEVFPLDCTKAFDMGIGLVKQASRQSGSS